MGLSQSKEKTVTGKSGKHNQFHVSYIDAEVVSIEFENSHSSMGKDDILKDGNLPERFRIDWGYSGELYSEPEWEREGQNAPVSYSRNEKMRLSLGVTIKSRGDVPSSLEGKVAGHPMGPSRQRFKFESDVVDLMAGTEAGGSETNMSVSVVGQAPLPNWPARLDKQIKWTFCRRGKNLDLGRSGAHTVFVTFGPPIDDYQTTYEDGATLARMREAARRVSRIDSCSSVKLIKKLFDQFDDYVLTAGDLPKRKRKEVDRDEALRTYMKTVNWPGFLKPDSSVYERVEATKEWTSCLEHHMEGSRRRAREMERDLEEAQNGAVGTKRSRAREWDVKVRKKRALDMGWGMEGYACDRDQNPERVIDETETAEAELTKLKLLVEEGERNLKEQEEAVWDRGGAWPLAVLERYGGECQAIVRFIRGVLMQLGHSREIQVQYVSADVPHHAGPIPTICSDGSACTGPLQNHGYSLVDTPLQAGGQYAQNQVKWNNFEAFLVYRYKENGQFFQAWYGGGVGLVEKPQPEPLTPAFKRTLLEKSFEGVAEWKMVGQGGERKREVTRYWSFR